MVDGEGSEKMLELGMGVGVIKRCFQKHLKIEGG